MARRSVPARKSRARTSHSRKRDGTPAHSATLIAFSIHVFTALGAGCAIMALVAATRARWTELFTWLGLALLIDGVDGTLARRFRVADVLPRWSGDKLDLVVDFTTYVFVPAYALAASGLLPQLLAIPLSIAIVVSAAIYCADNEMKLTDNSFRGFPVLWNALALHLFVLKLSPWLNVAIVAVFVVLTFAPYRTIHPLRMPATQMVNALALLAWSALALYSLWHGLDPGFGFALALAALSLYFLAAGLFLPATHAEPER